MHALIGRYALMLGAASTACVMAPLASPAAAQGGRGGSICRALTGQDRVRCERGGDRQNRRQEQRRERERDRRKDAKTDGIVAGVIGTAILGGIVAAAVSGNKSNDAGDHRDDCERRYGSSYDAEADQYRASDGRWYPCERR